MAEPERVDPLDRKRSDAASPLPKAYPDGSTAKTSFCVYLAEDRCALAVRSI